MFERFTDLDRRLAAIERWVGMRPDLEDLDRDIVQVRRQTKTAVGRQDFEAAAALRDKEKRLLAAWAAREQEWMETAAGRPSLASEFAAEHELGLRAILRQHGIEPDDDAA